jgi:hypothetical protein
VFNWAGTHRQGLGHLARLCGWVLLGVVKVLNNMHHWGTRLLRQPLQVLSVTQPMCE